MGIDGLWYFWTGSPHLQIDPPTVTLAVPLNLAEGAHLVEIWASDNSGNVVYETAWFTVNSVFETFYAEWVDLGSGLALPEGATVAMSTVILRGVTDPNSAVAVSSPGGMYSTTADNVTGYFELNPFVLVNGLNIATVTATNSGNVSVGFVKMISSDTYCTLWTLEAVHCIPRSA